MSYCSKQAAHLPVAHCTNGAMRRQTIQIYPERRWQQHLRCHVRYFHACSVICDGMHKRFDFCVSVAGSALGSAATVYAADRQSAVQLGNTFCCSSLAQPSPREMQAV